jgi:predicted nucleotide-binding protein
VRKSPEFKKWQRDTEIAIANIFGENARHINDFKEIRYSLGNFRSGTPESRFQEVYIDGLHSAQSVLQSMIDEIKEYWEDDTVSTSSTTIPMNINIRNIFIIHGHDHGAKETVARFLSNLKLNPIILHEQPNLGRTIIQKFEEHTEKAAYAIALLTPDDIGAAESERDNLRNRARQNVIFEFGYFRGKLGPKRVCGLKKGNIEDPTDLSGVIYIPLDDKGAWKTELVKEMKAVGIDIDANLVF